MAGSWSAASAPALRGCAGGDGPDVAVVGGPAARCGRRRAVRPSIRFLPAGRRSRPPSAGSRSCCRWVPRGHRKVDRHRAPDALLCAPGSRCHRAAPLAPGDADHPCRAEAGSDGRWAQQVGEAAAAGRAFQRGSTAGVELVAPAAPPGRWATEGLLTEEPPSRTPLLRSAGRPAGRPERHPPPPYGRLGPRRARPARPGRPRPGRPRWPEAEGVTGPQPAR